MTNQVVQGDCLELLKTIASDSIDVSFADPPFNLGKRYSAYKDHVPTADYLAWCELWLTELVRVSKHSIFVHNIPKWLVHFASILNKLAEFKHWISWDASSGPMGKSLQPSHYGILYYVKGNSKFYELRYPHKRCRKCAYLLKDYGGKKSSLHPFGPLVSDVWTDIHRVKHHRDAHPCFVGSSKVYTATGISTIDAINVGDFVLTHKGRYRKVLSVFKIDNKPTVTLKVIGLEDIKTTGNHPFLIINKPNIL